MSIVKLNQVDPAQLTFSKSSYKYGPNGNIVYVNYASPRQSLHFMCGPFQTPWGISAYENDYSKLSITLNIPEGEVTQKFEELDNYLRDTALPANCTAAWTPYFKANYIEGNYTSSLSSSTNYGSQLRLSIRKVEAVDEYNLPIERVKPLMMCKKWLNEQDHSMGAYIEKVEYASIQELTQLFPPGCRVYVLVQMDGIVLSRNSVSPKYSCVQVIRDLTWSPVHDEHTTSFLDNYTTFPDLSFLD